MPSNVTSIHLLLMLRDRLKIMRFLQVKILLRRQTFLHTTVLLRLRLISGLIKAGLF